MKPCAFDYIRVDTVDQALSVLAKTDRDVKILAGGQSLLPILNMRLARPGAVLDINRIEGLNTLKVSSMQGENGQQETDMLEVGALVRQRQIERYSGSEPRLRLIHSALLNIGHPQTRNRGTVGGSLVHADASAELPLVFLTLGGSVLLQSARGERTVAAEDFFLSHYTTSIEPDELLVKGLWRLPLPHEGVAFKEFRRRHGDFALMAAACTMQLDEAHRIQRVRLGLGGIAETPILVDEVQALLGVPWTRDQGSAIAEAVVQRLEFTDDAHAAADYRRQLAAVLVARILEVAHGDALAGREAVHA